MFSSHYKNENLSIKRRIEEEIKASETLLELKIPTDTDNLSLESCFEYLMELKSRESYYWSGFFDNFPSAVAVLDRFQNIVHSNQQLNEFLSFNPAHKSQLSDVLNSAEGSCEVCDFVKVIRILKSARVLVRKRYCILKTNRVIRFLYLFS